MTTWPEVALGTLCALGPQPGVARATRGTEETYPEHQRARYLSLADIDANGQLRPAHQYVDADEYRDFLLDHGDIGIVRHGPDLGRVYHHRSTDGPCVLSSSLLRIRPEPSLIEATYLASYLHTRRARAFMERRGGHHAMPVLQAAPLAALPVPLATPGEQGFIVEILDMAEKLRVLRTRANAKLGRVEVALLQGIIGSAHEPVAPWPSVRLDEVAEAMMHRADPRSSAVVDMPFVRPVDLGSRRAPAILRQLESRPRFAWRFEPDHVLLARRSLRDVAAVHPGYAGLCSPAIVVLACRDQRLSPRLLATFLRTRLLASRLGVAAPNLVNELRWRDIRDLPVPILSAEMRDIFLASTVECDAVMAHQTRTTALIDELYQGLIERAFTGQLSSGWRHAHQTLVASERAKQARLLAHLGIEVPHDQDPPSR